MRKTRVRWKEQCWPGDVLHFSAKVVKKYESDTGERRVDLELSAVRAGGGDAVQAWATFVVPR